MSEQPQHTSNPNEEKVRLHAFVEGAVQGVGFRQFVRTNASVLGLRGWVRNTYSGKVEVVAEGSYDALERLLELLRRGPRSAYVTGVSQEWFKPTGEFRGFEVRSST